MLYITWLICLVPSGLGSDDRQPHEYGAAVRAHGESVRQVAQAQRLLGPVPQGAYVRARPGGIRQLQVGDAHCHLLSRVCVYSAILVALIRLGYFFILFVVVFVVLGRWWLI